VSRWRPIVTTLLCVVGLGLGAFLTWGHYFDQQAISNSCPMAGAGGGLVDCGLVTSSSESVIFGLPVALYGLVYFVVMLGLCLPVAWRSPSALIAKARLGLNIAGIGFILYLVGVEFLQLHHICLYCTFVHVVQFALFIIVVTGWYDTGYVAARDGYDESDASPAPKGSLVA
jgi:uncharacterized membrane protein